MTKGKKAFTYPFYTGLGPGEKLYEELMTEAEGVIPTEHGKIMILKCREVDMELLNAGLIKLKQGAEKQSKGKIRALLPKIVPEYNNA